MGKKSKSKKKSNKSVAATNASSSGGGGVPSLLFGIGGAARPMIEPGRKAIIHNLNSRPELNGNQCTIKQILSNGRVAIAEFSTFSHTGVKEFDEKRNETISVLPTKLEVIWEIKNNNSNKDIKEIEENTCPICIDTVMITNVNASLYSCCGGRICNKCFANIMTRGTNPDSCPLCAADTSDCSDAAELKRITQRANRGDANACYNLGGYYDYGGKMGLKQDQKRARYYYKIAAEKGEVRAALNLGCCHRDGEGGPKDLVEAAKWFRLSAEGGHTPAITNLGLAYMRGHGVPQNFDEAEKWLKLGIQQGDTLAAQQLSVMQMVRSNPSLMSAFR